MSDLRPSRQKLWGPHEIGPRVGVTAITIRNVIERGDLKAFRVGKRYRVAYKDIEAWIGPERTADLFGKV